MTCTAWPRPYTPHTDCVPCPDCRAKNPSPMFNAYCLTCGGSGDGVAHWGERLIPGHGCIERTEYDQIMAARA